MASKRLTEGLWGVWGPTLIFLRGERTLLGKQVKGMLFSTMG